MKYSFSHSAADSLYLDELLSSVRSREDEAEPDFSDEPLDDPDDHDYDETDETDALAMDLLGYTSRRSSNRNSYQSNVSSSWSPEGYTSSDANIQRTIAKESGGNPYAVSPKGARGLMQIMPVALKEFNQFNKTGYTMDDMFDSEKNIQVGSWYKQQRIPQMLRSFGLDVNDFNIEAAYNGGIGRVVDYHKRGKALPSETQSYVRKQFGGAGDPVTMAISEGVKLAGEFGNSYMAQRKKQTQLVEDGVDFLNNLTENTLTDIYDQDNPQYAQQGFSNPYQQQQFVLNTTQQQSVIPQFVPSGGGTPQSAEGLKPQPNQQLWQDASLSFLDTKEAQPEKAGNFLATPLKILGNLAGKLIPKTNSLPVAAGIATSVFNARNAAQQKNELMEKIAKRNDQSKFVNGGKGLEYNPLYVKHGGRSKYTFSV